MALVSIIIPHHNRLDLLRLCLASLRAQTLADIAVTVVDNGSTDGSPEALRQEYPGVRTLTLERNEGFAAAVNRGIRSSSSPYVMLLNNDVRCEPGCVAELVGALENTRGASWAAPLTLRGDDPDRVDNTGLVWSRAGVARKRHAGLMRERVPSRLNGVFGASGNAALFRSSFFEAVGLLDERFFAYCEDWELALRARRGGVSCVFVPSAVCRHHESSTWGRNSDRTIQHFQRNMEVAYFGPWGWRFHARYLVPHLLYSLFCVARWTWRGKGKLAMRAKWDALRLIRRPRSARSHGDS